MRSCLRPQTGKQVRLSHRRLTHRSEFDTNMGVIKTSQPKQSIYVAFLRGINVGGKNMVAMSDLAKAFAKLGFNDVTTVIQSGNVIFGAAKSSPAKLAAVIERELVKRFGFEIAVFLRTADELRRLVARRPVETGQANETSKPYITLVHARLTTPKKLPLWSPKRDVEVYEIAGNNVYCRAHRIGKEFGFPNGFIEKEFRVPATTRNWNTLEKIAEKCSPPAMRTKPPEGKEKGKRRTGK